MIQKRIKFSLTLLFSLALFTFPVIGWKTPLIMFAGQESTYTWTSSVNTSEWLPHHDPVCTISARAVYLIQTVNADHYIAAVDIHGDVDWPQGSINHSVLFGMYVEYPNIWNYEEINSSGPFELSYHVVVHETGSVRTLDSPSAIGATYSFPELNESIIGITMTQERPGVRSCYYLDDVEATVGQYVGVGLGLSSKVVSHEVIDTPVGLRPALKCVLNDTTSYINPPVNTSIYYTYYFDQKTGFLLNTHQTRTIIDIQNSITTTWVYEGELIATNMFIPRLEQLLPYVILSVMSISVLITGIIIYHQLLKKRT